MNDIRIARVAALALTLAALLLAGASPLAAQGADNAEISARVIARVSGKFVAPAGTEPPGFDVEILKRFASWHKVKTGKPLKLAFDYSPTVPALLEAVQTGSDQLGIGGVTATAERAKLVDFSLPILPVRSVVIAPPGILDAARWRQQIKGLRVGATVGSTNAAEVERLAASLGGVMASTGFASNEAVFDALGARPRGLDAALVDLPQFWTNGKQKGLVLVDSVGQPQTMAFVLRKGSPWKAQLDQFLDGFTHSSEYFQLIRRYFGQDAEQMVRLSRGG